jgi:hypothetical protein
MAGSRPTMMNSVVSTVNPAADNRKMGNSMQDSSKTTTPALAKGPLEILKGEENKA